MPSLDEFARQKLGALDEAHLRRTLVPTGRHGDLWVERNGRRLLSFSCNDYLGLTHHPALKAAARPNAHVHILSIATHCLTLAGRADEARKLATAIQRSQPGYGVEHLLAAFRYAPDGEALMRRAAAQLPALKP